MNDGKRVIASSTVVRQRGFVVGVGSERGTPLEVIGQGVMQCLDRLRVDIDDVCLVTSIRLKQYDPAYGAFARIHRVPFSTCDAVQLRSVAAYEQGQSVPSYYEPVSVSKYSALFFSGARELLAPPFYYRLCLDNHSVTVSVCETV